MTNKKITTKFEIVRETKKALLLQEGDKTFWIQRRWLRDDGSLTPAGEKSRAGAKTNLERIKEKIEKDQAKEEAQLEQIILRGEIVRETRKAYLFKADCDKGGLIYSHDVWVPKSQVFLNPDGNELTLPRWLMEEKQLELPEGNFDIY